VNSVRSPQPASEAPLVTSSQSSTPAPKESQKKKRAARKSPPIEALAPATSELPVQFAYENANAREVFIAASFNDWNPKANPLSKASDGRWTAELLLKPGFYEYRLVVDGAWIEDPKSVDYVPNPFGGVNSAITVGT